MKSLGFNNFGLEYVPKRLPCGKEINKYYISEKEMQCCRTECPHKSNDSIEVCYDEHKYGHYRGNKPSVQSFTKAGEIIK